MKRIAMILATFILLLLIFIIPVQGSNNGTNIKVFVETDGNITASFNATADGIISYFIDGIEVKGEFGSLWNAIAGAGIDIDKLEEAMHSNYLLASQAFNLAYQNDEVLEEHGNTLMFHYDAINDTYTKLYILRDEVVSFEEHYLNFENKTNNTLGIYGNNIAFHQDEINTLHAEIKNLNGIIILTRNALIGISIIVGALYLINRRHPVKNMIFNNFNSLKHNNRTYKVSKHGLKAKALKSRRNNSNILKQKMIFLKNIQIRRNKNKTLVQSLFPFLFIKK